MKILLGLIIVLAMGGCTAKDVSRHILEKEMDIKLGNSGSYCAQVKMQCAGRPDDPVASQKRYTEWKNSDGTIGCRCG